MNKVFLDYYEESAANFSDKTAIEFDGKKISYAEVDRLSDNVAIYLQAKNISNSLVGICMDRIPDIIISILGIWKSGNAYVPLDPNYPKKRLEYIVSDAKIELIITSKSVKEQASTLGAKRCETIDIFETNKVYENDTATTADDSAYAIYTSGSTGNPKGVLIPHGAFGNFITSMKKCPGITSDDRMLFNTTISFDISTLEMFLPLAAGATVVMSSNSAQSGGEALATVIDNNNITIMQGTPSMYTMLVDAGWQGNDRIKLLCGGEAITNELAEDLYDRCGSLWNMYGPTETTVWSTVAKLERGKKITLGNVVDNTSLHILDDNMQPVNAGESGELYIGGLGLSKGYIGRDDLTKERFIPDIDKNGLVYKTGDVVKILEDGQIEYQGRADFQVKLRGHRIELGEIETVINSFDGIRQSIVVLVQINSSDKKLVAYYTLRDDVDEIDVNDLKKLVGEKLPNYMMPNIFREIDVFPLTDNGKINRKALQEMKIVMDEVEISCDEDMTELEEQIAGIWCEVLSIDAVGKNDDFLDLGGHSLLANRLVILINRTFGIKITLLELLTKGMTVSELSELVEEKMMESLATDEEMQKMLEEFGDLSEEEIMKMLEEME